jgi:hypothetical protein
MDVIGEVLGTWYIIALIILLVVLVGVLFYLKKHQEDD